MTSDTAIELHGVRKTYPGFTLKDVSFTLLAGRDVALEAAVQWIRRLTRKGRRS